MPSSPPPSTTATASSELPNPPRRGFLAGLLAAGAAGVGALLALPVVKFVLHPVLAQTTDKSWSEVGSVDEFQSLTAPVKKLVQIEQLDGWRRIVAQKPVYVVKDSSGQIAVLSAVCTHLGCSLPWVDEKNQFICPCHKGTFDASGKLVSGPPPRNMDALLMKVEDGLVKIQYEFFRPLVHDKEVVA
jgi:menaquinol-cytochrome c reductase iron-sulfur subunit